MNRTKVVFIFAAMSVSAWGQTGMTFSTTGQPTIYMKSKLEPDKPPLGREFTTGSASTNKAFQRYLYDKVNHQYFGYSLALERVSSSEYRLILGPLQLNPAENPISDSLAQMMPAPVFPAAQVVRVGDEIAIDVFENSKTGQKIVDHLWLERQNCEGESRNADCLAAAVGDASGELERKIQALQARQDASGQQRLRQSQQSWEAYLDDACRSLPDRAKQLECRLKLTRSRINDLGVIY